MIHQQLSMIYYVFFVWIVCFITFRTHGEKVNNTFVRTVITSSSIPASSYSFKIKECDSISDCINDTDCMDGLVCARNHVNILFVYGLDTQKAYCTDYYYVETMKQNESNLDKNVCYDPKKLFSVLGQQRLLQATSASSTLEDRQQRWTLFKFLKAFFCWLSRDSASFCTDDDGDLQPTASPTVLPPSSVGPSSSPPFGASNGPTPTNQPSDSNTVDISTPAPSMTPTPSLSSQPASSVTPTPSLSTQPSSSMTPTPSLSTQPSDILTLQPTSTLTDQPSDFGTSQPTSTVTDQPSDFGTESPTVP